MRIAITLLLIVLMGTSHAQQPALRSALGGKPAVAATVDVAEERAKLETQLGETLRRLTGGGCRGKFATSPIILVLFLWIFLKIHQMQIIRGPELATEYAEHPFHVYTVEEYIDVIVKYIQLLRKDLVLERFVSQSPKELLVAPKWGLKNYEFTNLLNNRLKIYNKYGKSSNRYIKLEWSEDAGKVSSECHRIFPSGC